MKKALFALISILGSTQSAFAVTCDYNYESEGQKVAAVFETGKMNDKDAFILKEVTTGEVLWVFAIIRESKTAFGTLIEGETAGVKANFSIPSVLPNPGAIIWDPEGEALRETLKCRASLTGFRPHRIR